MSCRGFFSPLVGGYEINLWYAIFIAPTESARHAGTLVKEVIVLQMPFKSAIVALDTFFRSLTWTTVKIQVVSTNAVIWAVVDMEDIATGKISGNEGGEERYY
jgi:hypothetical protein